MTSLEERTLITQAASLSFGDALRASVMLAKIDPDGLQRELAAGRNGIAVMLRAQTRKRPGRKEPRKKSVTKNRRKK